MAFINFMNSAAGRAIRIVAGLALILIGLVAIGGTGGIIVAVIGLVPLGAGAANVCIVGKLFGIRYLATLFGLTLLSHQIGGFLGAYLGGLVITQFGDFGWMWYADMALAVMAAILNLPIREAPVARKRAAA